MVKKKEDKEKYKTKCSKCNSSLIYIRIKTREKVCRNCGFIESFKEGDK